MRIFKRVLSICLAAIVVWQSAIFLGIADEPVVVIGDDGNPVAVAGEGDPTVPVRDGDSAASDGQPMPEPQEAAGLDLFRHQFYDSHPVDAGSELTTVAVDDGNIIHKPFEYVEPSDSAIAAFSLPPSSGPFYVGDTRVFYLYIYNNSYIDTVNGKLFAQGQHSNVWILDDDHFHQVVEYPHDDATCALRSVTQAQANDIANTFDDIYRRMTDAYTGFGAHNILYEGYGNIPLVGDLGQDGKFNIVLYDIYGDGRTSTSSGYIAGFFTNGDLRTGLQGNNLDMVNIDIGVHQGYRALTTNPMSFYSTLAHEFQHFLFYTHFGFNMVTTANHERYSWFNEALSGLAESYYVQPDAQLVKTSVLPYGVDNPYTAGGSGYGDFVNFNQSYKNYSMGQMHSIFLHNIMDGTYGYNVYRAFDNVLPSGSNSQKWTYLTDTAMDKVVGDIFSEAMGLGISGSDAFESLYYLFMESFAADGGTLQAAPPASPQSTDKFFVDTSSNYNLWDRRTSLATLPTISSGGNVTLVGYNDDGTPSTHEMLYRIGSNSALPMLTIQVDSGNSRDRYYVALANATGAAGADVYPLDKNTPNAIDTGGREAYLFAVTLFENIVANPVTYSWSAPGAAILTGQLSFDTPQPVYGVHTSVTATLNNCNIATPTNLQYDWYVGRDPVSNSGLTYSLQPQDIGKSIYLHVTDATGAQGGRLTISTAPVVRAANPYTPAPPVLVSKTSTTVTLQAQSGYEYSNGGELWQDSSAFVNLAPGTTYSFYQRVRATGSAGASYPSAALPVTTDPPVHVPATGVTLSKTSTTLSVGGSDLLTATVLPTNATNRAVSWRSSNTAVAAVSAAGVVTGVGPGSAAVTATTSDGGFAAACQVTVNQSSGSGGSGGGSGGSGGSGGGSGGGYGGYGPYYYSGGGASTSPASTTTATAVAERWVEADTSSYLNISDDRTTLWSRYNGVFGIRKDALAKYNGLRYYHDTVIDKSVVVRITLPDIGLIQGDLKLSGHVSGAAVTKREAQFTKWYANKLKVIHLDQQDDFGQRVGIAAKVDLSGMDPTKLTFYSYQEKTNTYYAIPDAQYSIDAGGYLHFSTRLGGDIVVSENALTAK